MLVTVNAQTWELVDDLNGLVTDIEMHNGQRYATFITGELLQGDSIIHVYDVQNTNETGLHAVTFWHDSLCVYLSSPDSVQRVICGTDTLLNIPYKNPWSNRHRGGGFISTPKILYVGVGSGNDPNDAQDSLDYRGKIVAIRSDTTYIYASGLRNPWKMDIKGDTLYIADVGDHAWEEIDRIDTSGHNLGWPCYEGNAVHDTVPPCENVTFPFYTYPREAAGNAIIGGVWFQNRYWWCDNYFEFGGSITDDTFNIPIPCPLWPIGMYTNLDTLFVYDYSGKIYRWQELPLSLDTTVIEQDTTHKETREEREYRYWVYEMILRYGGDPYMTMDRKVVNGLPEIPGVYWSLIRRKGYVVLPTH